MRVVVLGATGNVGTSVVRALAADPEVERIVGVARRRPEIELPEVEWRAADIVSDDLAPLLAGADAVVHLAWVIQPSRDRETTRGVNVEGSRRVFEAVARAGVPALVYASSVGAYSEGPKDRAVDESWPTGGVETSFYAVDKAAVERVLDEFEAANQEVRVVRLRPGLIFKREAATGIRRLFMGPLFPGMLARPALIPLVPEHERLRFQAVHTEDVAEAYRLAVTGRARGAFNVAADPVLDSKRLGELLGARPVHVAAGLLRAGAALAWRTRLIPAPPGWVDMAFAVPVMDTRRAREELGWAPRYTSTEALSELLVGLREGSGYPTPPLDPKTSGPLRGHELRTGVGART
jgi:nucleoside-diphosphate-sugar epimerase